jgi:hypothetical protein
MNDGWELIGKDKVMMLKKFEHTIYFNIKIYTPKGALYAMYIEREHKIGAVTKNIKMMIKQAHDKLGHCSEDLTQKMAKQLRWTINSRALGPCESCAAGKAKQKNVPKISEKDIAKKGES